MAQGEDTAKPDFRNGFPMGDLRDGGMVLGQADGEDVILVRRGSDLFAIGAHCTHYHGPLADGLLVGEDVRCPWHHACFSLRTGEALRAPALDPVTCWRVERVSDRVFVREKCAQPVPKSAIGPRNSRTLPNSVVIVGGGGAGLAAADMLRREGYDGAVTMISADDSAPYDRPNLSKDFLAGTAPDDWIPLRSAKYYVAQRIDLVGFARVIA
jgi:nitrite reductase/ring-hydroxylating ferredoxin subunit